MDNMDYMDCGLYGFLLLRFLEKESAKTAAARNPKGDKSGRGLASLRAAARALLVDPPVWNLPKEFRAVAVKHSYRESGRPAPEPRSLWRPRGWGACVGAYWGLLGLKTA